MWDTSNSLDGTLSVCYRLTVTQIWQEILHHELHRQTRDGRRERNKENRK